MYYPYIMINNLIKKISFLSVFIINILILLTFSSYEKENDPEINPLSEIALNGTNSNIETIIVSDKNPDTFRPSLIDAINKAGSNGTVELLAGVYTSNKKFPYPQPKQLLLVLVKQKPLLS